MDCETARHAILERGLGSLPAPARRRLDDHLAACSGCRRVAEAESWIDESLATLGQASLSRVDVVATVMRVVAGEPAPGEVSDRQLARGAAWAATASLTLLTAAVVFHPVVLRSLRVATAVFEGLLAMGAALLRPLLQTCGAVAGSAYRILAETAPPETWPAVLEILAGASAVACCAVMLAATTLVIGRDLRRPRPAHPRGER